MGIYKRKPDIIIRNGCIVDGTGKLPYYADIAVIGDKIDYIGDLKGVEAAKLDIDAHHKYVTNGFIDSHAHSDTTIWANADAASAVLQGVTTEIEGNCGSSMGTALDGCEWEEKGREIDCVYNLPGPEYPKGSMAAVLDKMEAMGSSINTAWLCGHNSLRTIAGCFGEEPTEEQYAVMESFLREAMDAGFIGFSTGLEFNPGILSKPKEVERLARIAGEYDANYSTHMRDEGTYLLEAVNEFLNVCRTSGLRGTVSHLNVKYDNGIPNDYLQRAMQMLKDARDIEHLNVMCDMLPTPFATGGMLAMLPPWLYENGWEDAQKKFRDPVIREKVKNDMCRYWRFLAYGQWDRLLYILPTYKPELCSVPFAEQAAASGKEPCDYFLDILMEAPSMEEAGHAFMIGNVFFEQQLVDSVVTDPIYMWQSDSRVSLESGPLTKNTENNQNFMGMIYFITHYVRDTGVISIQDACKKLGMVPAAHFMLEGRGTLEVGKYADINVFDINELKINSNFGDVFHYTSGMDYVIVNGTPVVAKGEYTGRRAGRVLRHLPKD